MKLYRQFGMFCIRQRLFCEGDIVFSAVLLGFFSRGFLRSAF